MGLTAENLLPYSFAPPPRPPDLDEFRMRKLESSEDTAAWCRELQKSTAAFQAEMAAFRSEMRNEFQQLRLIFNPSPPPLLDGASPTIHEPQTQSSLVTTPPIQPPKIHSTFMTLPPTHSPTSQSSLLASQPIQEPHILIVHSHLWKARCKQVVLKSTAATRGVRKPRQLRLGIGDPNETCKYQKHNEFLIRKPQFQHIVVEITQYFKTVIRSQSSIVHSLLDNIVLPQSNNLSASFCLVSGIGITVPNFNFVDNGCDTIDFVLGARLSGINENLESGNGREMNKCGCLSVNEDDQGLNSGALHLFDEMLKLNWSCYANFGEDNVYVDDNYEETQGDSEMVLEKKWEKWKSQFHAQRASEGIVKEQYSTVKDGLKLLNGMDEFDICDVKPFVGSVQGIEDLRMIYSISQIIIVGIGDTEIDALEFAGAPYGIEVVDSILGPLWKGSMSHIAFPAMHMHLLLNNQDKYVVAICSSAPQIIEIYEGSGYEKIYSEGDLLLREFVVCYHLKWTKKFIEWAQRPVFELVSNYEPSDSKMMFDGYIYVVIGAAISVALGSRGVPKAFIENCYQSVMEKLAPSRATVVTYRLQLVGKVAKCLRYVLPVQKFGFKFICQKFLRLFISSVSVFDMGGTLTCFELLPREIYKVKSRRRGTDFKLFSFAYYISLTSSPQRQHIMEVLGGHFTSSCVRKVHLSHHIIVPDQCIEALRSTTNDEVCDCGAGPLFNILHFLVQPTWEDHESYLLIEVIDILVYKLVEVVRLYVHKILMMIKILVIDGDCHALFKGTEDISNLGKTFVILFHVFFEDPDAEVVVEIENMQDVGVSHIWIFMYMKFTQNLNYDNLHDVTHWHSLDYLPKLVGNIPNNWETNKCVPTEDDIDLLGDKPKALEFKMLLYCDGLKIQLLKNVSSVKPLILPCLVDLHLTIVLCLGEMEAGHKSKEYLLFEATDYPAIPELIYIFLVLESTLCVITCSILIAVDIALGAIIHGHMLHDKVLGCSTFAGDSLDGLPYDLGDNFLAGHNIDSTILSILNTSATELENYMASQLANVVDGTLATSLGSFLILGTLLWCTIELLSRVSHVGRFGHCFGRNFQA